MALDGITVASLASEWNRTLAGARISKIAQPEEDELLLTLKSSSGQRRLLLSANASLPLACLTDQNKTSPLTAPNFCMLLRKHIANGRILGVRQPGLERILILDIEHLDELGDPGRKQLIVELMGKHSNIIFCDEQNRILDSIKHISARVSSVREVLPGKEYFIPVQEGKKQPLEETARGFCETVSTRPLPVFKAIYTSYTGISPLAANEICFRAGIDGGIPCAALGPQEWDVVARAFIDLMQMVKQEDFHPHIYKSGEEPVEFSAYPLASYADCTDLPAESISEVLLRFYAEKSERSRMRQKTADLRHITGTYLERSRKKYELQKKQLEDTKKREKYRLYGEFIHAYGYDVKEGAKSFEALNYYTNERITVPLDPDLTPAQNAKKYFERYGKLKRTYEALTVLIEETKAEMEHLDSIAAAIDLAQAENDLVEIRRELCDSGYIRRRSGTKKKQDGKSLPYHYRTADGIDIYVGKNNYQNDELTFHMAEGNDWWFHAKKMPGSHVLVKTKTGVLPDRTFEEAGRLAAYYSRGRGSEKVEVDYLQKKNVKKPNKAKPGFVVYYTNYSLTVPPDITGLELISG